MPELRYLARSGGLLGFAEQARAGGQDPEALLAEVGLPAAALRNPDLYLSYTRMARLYELAAERLDDPLFGLHLGQRQSLEVVGALGAYLCRQATLGDALMALQRNLGFHARGIGVQVRIDGDWMVLEMAVEFAERMACGQLLALSLVLAEQGLSDLQPRHEPPVAVWLGLPRPPAAERAAYERFFRCPVQFGGQRHGLRYPLRLLGQPVAVREGLRQRLLQHWRGDAMQAAPLALTEQVARAMAALLPTGDCSLDTVAGLLGMHARTLQSALQAQGSGYDRLLRGVRRELACAHLAGSDIGLTRLALDLGYAELAVFSRAFRTWTGVSPRRWRQQQRAGTGT